MTTATQKSSRDPAGLPAASRATVVDLADGDRTFAMNVAAAVRM